jgi:hypothetical protein
MWRLDETFPVSSKSKTDLLFLRFGW